MIYELPFIFDTQTPGPHFPDGVLSELFTRLTDRHTGRQTDRQTDRGTDRNALAIPCVALGLHAVCTVKIMLIAPVVLLAWSSVCRDDCVSSLHLPTSRGHKL